MTAEELKELKKGIILTAKYYGRELLPDVVGMMAEDLADLDFQAVSGAFKSYRLDPRNSTFPLPGKIRAIVQPKANARDAAQEIAHRCFGAIRKFGYTKPDQARAYVGELGWRLIERRGGWYNHCNDTMEREIPTLTAQFRDSLVSYVEQGEVSDELYFANSQITGSQEVGGLIEPRKESMEIGDPDVLFHKKKDEAISRFLLKQRDA